MTSGIRLTSEGILYTNGAIYDRGISLDEVSKTVISLSTDTLYASEFDEVTLNPIQNGLAKKEFRDGKYQIAGYFDEYTYFYSV